jgi:hypothetical protein
MLYFSSWAEVEPKTSVVIVTDCIGSCKSNYHTITATMSFQLGTDHLTCRGGLWFFVSFRKFFSDNTRVRIFLFLSRKAQFFFPELNIRLYDKNSESDFFFILHQNQNNFFSIIGNQNIFTTHARNLLLGKKCLPMETMHTYDNFNWFC